MYFWNYVAVIFFPYFYKFAFALLIKLLFSHTYTKGDGQCICRLDLAIFTLVSDRRCHCYVRGRLLINIAVNCSLSFVILSRCFGFHVDDDDRTAQSHCTAI